MRVVAVIGASKDRRKYGNKALRAFRAQGYTVVPINPHEDQIEGERVYRSVLDYPGPIDEATLYVRPEVGIGVMDDLVIVPLVLRWLLERLPAEVRQAARHR